MTLYDLYYIVRDTAARISSAGVPILKDGKEVSLDFHIVSEDGVVKHIEMTENERN